MPGKQKAKQRLREIAATALHYSGASRMLQIGDEHPWRILMYHRVVRLNELPYAIQPGMYVTPETFEMQMKYLAEHAQVVPLDDLARDIVQGKTIAPRTVAVTFDDGWVDTYTHAFPILKRYSIPATIFLVTSFIGTTETLWTDKVTLALMALREEKHYLQNACSRIKEMTGIEPAFCAEITKILNTGPAEELPEQFDALIEQLKRSSLKERKTIVSGLVNLAKEFTTLKIPRSFLSWDEVKEMTRDGVYFGSHSHKHYPLTELSEVQLTDDIENSFQVFREKGIAPSAVFCYPGGDYNELVQHVLAKHEIRFALTTAKTSNLNTLPHWSA
ncbi:MAG TPA: polysaccharide deacetylase family protein [Oligoflexia bacterium]|nr:polysaccharide deacetylase family protein [Oligoflexia bacterium]